MRISLVAIIAALLPSFAFGQSDAALRAAFAARTQAIVAGDSRRWGEYTTDDFVGISIDGSLMTKQERMKEIEGHASAAKSPTLTAQTWRLYGSSAIQSYHVMDGGHPVLITVVWVKQGARWRVASAQGTVIGTS